MDQDELDTVASYKTLAVRLHGAEFATPVLKAATPILDAEDSPHVKFDVDTGRIKSVHLRPDDASRPFTLIHEFGHVYHCHYWPEESATRPSAVAEAVAILCEAEASQRLYNMFMRKRPMIWPVEAAGLAMRALCRGGRLHDRIEALMKGEFGGG